MSRPDLVVVGGGFAGVEAAWLAAERGAHVELYEMRPVCNTPAHTTSYLAELVCSNSFKSKLPTSPAGQLKAEMDQLGSLVLDVARRNEVPAGQALGVDRKAFGEEITTRVQAHPNITLKREVYTAAQLESESAPVILATGPLTSPELSQWLAQATGRRHLYFYDAVSPTVEANTVDESIAFRQDRYDKGEGDDYLNCPFDRDEYYAFVKALVEAERAPVHAFEAGGRRDGESPEAELLEKLKYFSGCTPIEAIADKGERSLAFGNFKPVGLTDPRTGRRPYAALQLRPENQERTLYSLVACQTRLKWGEQKRVFRMVPGLQNAEFVRFGVIHRNTYVDAPSVLDESLQLRSRPAVRLAGQLTGVEGYLESAAIGILAGLFAICGSSPPPRASALGSLLSHLSDRTPREFAPMNVNWGLLPEPELATKDKSLRKAAKIEAAQTAFSGWLVSAVLGTVGLASDGAEV